MPHTGFVPISDIDKQNKRFSATGSSSNVWNRARWSGIWIFTLAQADDKGNDSTKAWPADRKTINAGTLVLNKAIPQQQGPCNDINYDPDLA